MCCTYKNRVAASQGGARAAVEERFGALEHCRVFDQGFRLGQEGVVHSYSRYTRDSVPTPLPAPTEMRKTLPPTRLMCACFLSSHRYWLVSGTSRLLDRQDVCRTAVTRNGVHVTRKNPDQEGHWQMPVGRWFRFWWIDGEAYGLSARRVGQVGHQFPEGNFTTS